MAVIKWNWASNTANYASLGFSARLPFSASSDIDARISHWSLMKRTRCRCRCIKYRENQRSYVYSLITRPAISFPFVVEHYWEQYSDSCVRRWSANGSSGEWLLARFHFHFRNAWIFIDFPFHCSIALHIEMPSRDHKIFQLEWSSNWCSVGNRVLI